MLSMMRGPPNPDAHPGFRALDEALDEYRNGMSELRDAARACGMTEWDFHQVAKATPNPVARGTDPGLRPFVRERR